MAATLGRRIYVNEMLVDKISRNKEYDKGSIDDSLKRYLVLKFKIEKNSLLKAEIRKQINYAEDQYDQIVEMQIAMVKQDPNSRYNIVNSRIINNTFKIQDVNATRDDKKEYEKFIYDDKKLLEKEISDIKSKVDRKNLIELQTKLENLDVTPEEYIDYEKLKVFFNGVYEFSEKDFEKCNDYLYSCFNEMYEKAKSFILKEESKYNIIISNYLKLVDRSSYNYDDPKFVQYLNYIKRKILLANNIVPKFDPSIFTNKSQENNPQGTEDVISAAKEKQVRISDIKQIINDNIEYDDSDDEEDQIKNFNKINDVDPFNPFIQPGVKPNVVPGVKPNVVPGVKPNVLPGVKPNVVPGVKPNVVPGVKPNVVPGVKPNVVPGVKPVVKYQDNNIENMTNKDIANNLAKAIAKNIETDINNNGIGIEKNFANINLAEAVKKALENDLNIRNNYGSTTNDKDNDENQKILNNKVINIIDPLALSIQKVLQNELKNKSLSWPNMSPTAPSLSQESSSSPSAPPLQIELSQIVPSLAKAIEKVLTENVKEAKQAEQEEERASQAEQERAAQAEQAEQEEERASQAEQERAAQERAAQEQAKQEEQERAKQEEQERAAREARVALLREPIEVSIENLNETSLQNELQKKLNNVFSGGSSSAYKIQRLNDKSKKMFKKKRQQNKISASNLTQAPSPIENKPRNIFGKGIMPLYYGGDENKDDIISKEMNKENSGTLGQKKDVQYFLDFFSEWKSNYKDAYDTFNQNIVDLNTTLRKFKETKQNILEDLKTEPYDPTLSLNIKLQINSDMGIANFETDNNSLIEILKTNSAIKHHISRYDQQILLENTRLLKTRLEKKEKEIKELKGNDVIEQIRNIYDKLISTNSNLQRYKNELDEKRNEYDVVLYNGYDNRKNELKQKIKNESNRIENYKQKLIKIIERFEFKDEININEITNSKNEILRIFDKYLKLANRKIKPAMMRTIGFLGENDESNSRISDSKFNRIWDKYLDDVNNDEKLIEQSQDKFYSSIKSNNLDPSDVLKPSRDDKIFFVIITFIVRQICLAIIETCIDKGLINSLYFALIFYLVAYTIVIILIVLLVNIDDYKLRIIFNFFNMHINPMGILSHIFMMIGFTMIMYLLVYYMNKDIHKLDRKNLSELEKINIVYKLELMTISVFTFVCITQLLM